MKMMPVLLVVCAVAVAGCSLPKRGDEIPVMIAAQLTEPEWIRNGEPVVVEAEEWYPTDEVENFLPAEVYEAGVFRDVPFYVEKTDIRPFERLYTRFAPNRYRAFEQ